jgi:hypothetical protein
MRARLTELRQIQEQIEETGEQASLTDPESRRMKVGNDLKVCYNAQIAVDPKHHLIVAHDVTNEENDLQQLEPMATAAKEALGVKSLEAGADAGYHNPSQIVACQDNEILPYVPDPATSSSKNRKAGLFTKEHFRYDEAKDAYQCPAGQWLHWSTQETRDGRLMKYYTNAAACRGCAMRAQCTKDKHGRRIMRIPEEAQIEAMRQRLASRAELMLLRKSTVEHPFGTIKHGWDAGYFLLKGLRQVRGEFSLSTLAYNIRRATSAVGAECLLDVLRGRRKALESGLQPV